MSRAEDLFISSTLFQISSLLSVLNKGIQIYGFEVKHFLPPPRWECYGGKDQNKEETEENNSETEVCGCRNFRLRFPPRPDHPLYFQKIKTPTFIKRDAEIKSPEKICRTEYYEWSERLK